MSVGTFGIHDEILMDDWLVALFGPPFSSAPSILTEDLEQLKSRCSQRLGLVSRIGHLSV